MSERICNRVIGCTRDGNGEPDGPLLCDKPATVPVPVAEGAVCPGCAAEIIGNYKQAVKQVRMLADKIEHDLSDRAGGMPQVRIDTPYILAVTERMRVAVGSVP